MSNKLSCKAALLCKDPQFRIWLDRRRAHKAGFDVPDGTHTEDDARQFILLACNIASRSELDTNPAAAATYQKIYRLQLNYWRRQRQIQRYGRA